MSSNSFIQVAPDRNKVATFVADTCTDADVTSSPDDWASEVREMIGNRPIDFAVLNPSGPGGGWPVVSYTGPEHTLLDLLQNNFDCPPNEAFEQFGIGTADDEPRSIDELHASVKLLGTADKVVGLHDSLDNADGWDWIAGYSVIKTSRGEHGGAPATRMTLGDSDGMREVGRLVLRDDALRGSCLEFVRQFETTEARDAFVARLTSDSGAPGDGWEKAEARTINVGDTVLDPADTKTEALVGGIEFSVVQSIGLPLIQLACGAPINDFVNLGLREEVWVKRA